MPLIRGQLDRPRELLYRQDVREDVLVMTKIRKARLPRFQFEPRWSPPPWLAVATSHNRKTDFRILVGLHEVEAERIAALLQWRDVGVQSAAVRPVIFDEPVLAQRQSHLVGADYEHVVAVLGNF